MTDINKIELYAWIGEDEYGGGEIGIKQAQIPAGIIPIVSTKLSKVNQEFIKEAMNVQGKTFKKRIMLCKFVFEEVILEVGDTEQT